LAFLINLTKLNDEDTMNTIINFGSQHQKRDIKAGIVPFTAQTARIVGAAARRGIDLQNVPGYLPPLKTDTIMVVSELPTEYPGPKVVIQVVPPQA
jgi:hypothetical protein